MIDRVAVLFSSAALVLSVILCIHALSGHGLIGCSAGTSCNEVLGSRWSYLFGLIPVSGLAVVCYVAMTLCLLFRRSFEADEQFFRWLDRATLVLAGAIAGSAIWFIWLQKNMIRSFCPYCMTAHVCGLILLCLLLAGSRQKFIARILCTLAGLALAGCLAGVQLATTPRTAYERGFIPEALPVPPYEEMPLIGSPQAEDVVTLMFDYRCSHCRKIHSLLGEVAGLLDGKVAFSVVPVPLGKDCNPYVPAGEDRFKGSCELTRYALALWRCDRDAYAGFDAWLFEDRPGGWYPREPGEAFDKACALVGRETLVRALSDPWISRYMADVCELFGRTSTQGKGAVPRFIHGDRWLVPDVDDASGLSELVRELLQ